MRWINENPWHSGILLAVDDSQASSTDISSDGSTTRGLEILSSEDSLRIRDSLRGDRYLRAAEITNWDLRADLAVLSGCESALGRITVGEGVIGLGGAFLSAGVRTVVASLWPVDDRRVETFMEIFYSGLADGKSVSAALNSAQLDLRSHDETQHPFYWAGMIVIGDGDAKIPIELRSQGPRPANLLWIAGVMAVIIFLGVRWRRQNPAPSR